MKNTHDWVPPEFTLHLLSFKAVKLAEFATYGVHSEEHGSSETTVGLVAPAHVQAKQAKLFTKLWQRCYPRREAASTPTKRKRAE